jgi:hypothetical protein
LQLRNARLGSLATKEIYVVNQDTTRGASSGLLEDAAQFLFRLTLYTVKQQSEQVKNIKILSTNSPTQQNAVRDLHTSASHFLHEEAHESCFTSTGWSKQQETLWRPKDVRHDRWTERIRTSINILQTTHLSFIDRRQTGCREF